MARVFALSPQGAELWRFDGGPGSLRAAPALDEDGGLYFGKELAKDQFYALNPDGSQKWNVGIDVVVVNTPVDVFSPAIGANGDVYFPVDAIRTHGLLVCLDAEDGSEKWRFETDGGLQSSPLVGFDETIYIGTRSNKLIAINPDGTQRWVFDMPTGSILSSPPIADNGTLYFGSNDTRLYAVHTSSAGLSVGSWPKHQRDVRNTGRLGSNTTRRRWFAPHVYWLDEENNAVVIISNIGEAQNPAGTASSRSPAGIGATTASFQIDVLNRDGSVFFSIEDSVDPGETKEFVLAAPDNSLYAAAAIIDSAVKDGLFLAPFLTWNLDVSAQLEPLAIGAFFSDPTDAAQLHHFPAEASASNGLGIGVQNIGKNDISCLLELFNADGTMAAQETIDLGPEASVVDFFNDLVLAGGASLQGGEPAFKGRGAFTCDAPVVAVAVNQDFANGGFPTDRITIKGVN